MFLIAPSTLCKTANASVTFIILARNLKGWMDYSLLSNGAGCRICMMCHIQAETHSWILTTYEEEKKTFLKYGFNCCFFIYLILQIGFSDFLQWASCSSGGDCLSDVLKKHSLQKMYLHIHIANITYFSQGETSFL